MLKVMVFEPVALIPLAPTMRVPLPENVVPPVRVTPRTEWVVFRLG